MTIFQCRNTWLQHGDPCFKHLGRVNQMRMRQYSKRTPHVAWAAVTCFYFYLFYSYCAFHQWSTRDYSVTMTLSLVYRVDFWIHWKPPKGQKHSGCKQLQGREKRTWEYRRYCLCHFTKLILLHYAVSCQRVAFVNIFVHSRDGRIDPKVSILSIGLLMLTGIKLAWRWTFDIRIFRDRL